MTDYLTAERWSWEERVAHSAHVTGSRGQTSFTFMINKLFLKEKNKTNRMGFKAIL